MKSVNLNTKAKEFEETVDSHFNYLEIEYGMKRHPVRIRDGKSQLDIAIIVRYESATHRLDIGWGINEQGIGILIWLKPQQDSVCKEYIYLEPFIEYATQGAVLPVVPQVYPGMSIAKIEKLMKERKTLFSSSLGDIVLQISERIKKYLPIVLQKKSEDYQAFHDWFIKHH